MLWVNSKIVYKLIEKSQLCYILQWIVRGNGIGGISPYDKVDSANYMKGRISFLSYERYLP